MILLNVAHHLPVTSPLLETNCLCFCFCFVLSRSPRPAASLFKLFLHRHVQILAIQASPGLRMDKEETNGVRESQDKEASDEVKRRILPHILNLYGACATAHDFEIYAPHASFEDPLMRAEGLPQIKSAFYSLSKVFAESKIVEYSVKENDLSATKKEILIDNKQHYKFMGRNIDMISLIRLYLEDGKVVRHEDWWDKKPLRNRETVQFPLVGRVLEAAKRGSMLATHVLMGFGKDPTK